MVRFRVKQTMPCWVTWTYEIEAPTEDEAREAFYQGDHSGPIGEPEIGDMVARAGDGEEDFEQLP